MITLNHREHVKLHAAVNGYTQRETDRQTQVRQTIIIAISYSCPSIDMCACLSVYVSDVLVILFSRVPYALELNVDLRELLLSLRIRPNNANFPIYRGIDRQTDRQTHHAFDRIRRIADKTSGNTLTDKMNIIRIKRTLSVCARVSRYGMSKLVML